MSQVITIKTKNNYGREDMYVISEHAPFIQQLTGKKTVTTWDLDSLKSLGYTIIFA